MLNILKYFPKTKIILVYHNNPLTLRGSEKVTDREYLITRCSKIIFVSRWIQQIFYRIFKFKLFRYKSYIPWRKKSKITKIKKYKNILFVGKLNKAKGYEIFVEAAKKFKKYDKSWNFIAIGNETRKKIFPDPNIVKEIGYKKNIEVLNYYKNSEIAVGNSVWDEPLGRIAIEASSRKCLPIISNKGGLAESKNIAIVLKQNDVKNLFVTLKKVTENLKYRRSKQDLFYKNNNFDLKKISNDLDKLRLSVFDIKDKNLSNKQKKILHIANFNENADGRLYYSFANKLNNGFIKNNYIVQTISDRLFLKSNRSFFQPFAPINKFNDKILNTLKNFSPDVLLIGHVFNINPVIYDYCKKNSIKIASWFIDSVSNEFLNGKKKEFFFKNLEYVDFCFLTSSPKLFKKNKFYKKLKFIPNPIDASIDNYTNFSEKKLDYDIFVAISHGQNRGILKKVKKMKEKIL